MYQKLTEIIKPKKEKAPKTPQTKIYIWKGSKVHFRGDCEFKDGDMIEPYVDLENRKILFATTNEPSKYARKLVLYGKTKAKVLSLKKVLELVKFTGKGTFKAEKLDAAQLEAIGLPSDSIAYEIDLNAPVPDNGGEESN